jgi:hypothetical protein
MQRVVRRGRSPTRINFLKALRLDITDGRLFGTDFAAEGKWVVLCGYAVSGPAARERCPLTHHDNTFIGVTSHGGCSFAEACDIDANLVAISHRLELPQIAENLPGKLTESAITLPEGQGYL